jgi:hypothetical protein
MRMPQLPIEQVQQIRNRRHDQNILSLVNAPDTFRQRLKGILATNTLLAPSRKASTRQNLSVSPYDDWPTEYVLMVRALKELWVQWFQH